MRRAIEYDRACALTSMLGGDGYGIKVCLEKNDASILIVQGCCCAEPVRLDLIVALSINTATATCYVSDRNVQQLRSLARMWREDPVRSLSRITCQDVQPIRVDNRGDVGLCNNTSKQVFSPVCLAEAWSDGNHCCPFEIFLYLVRLVECVSLAMCRGRNLVITYAFDHHFRAANRNGRHTIFVCNGSQQAGASALACFSRHPDSACQTR